MTNHKTQPGRRRPHARVLALAVALLVPMAAACGSDADSTESEGSELTFLFGNQRSIQYFPYYVAMDQGYFEDEGLDVTFEVVDGSSNVIQQVAAGNADVGLPAGSAVLQGVAQGLPLKIVYTSWYMNTFGLAVPEESGISSLEELGEGSTIGVASMSGGEVPEIRAIMSGELGFTEGKDYSIQAVGDGGALTYDALESGTVDAYTSSVFDIAAIEAAGMPLNQLFEGDYLYLPSLSQITSEETLDEREDDLARFMRAVIKGYRFAEANPEAAKAIAKEAQPDLFEDETIADAYWETTEAALLPPEELEGELLGSPYFPGWERYLSLISEGTEEEGGIPEGTIDLEELMDTRLLEVANDFDVAEVEKDAASASQS